MAVIREVIELSVEIIIGIAVAFIAIGLIAYLFRLNRRAKKEQSEVDPGKLRKWNDD